MRKISDTPSKVKSAHHPTDPPTPRSVPGFEAQARISCASSVANCLDTLKINFWIQYGDLDFFDHLEEAKLKAQKDDVSSEPIELGGVDWNCMRTGTRLFTYRLVKGDVQLLLSNRKPDSNLPNTRLEIGSISCWVPGYVPTYEKIIQVIEELGGSVTKEQVSEIHLAADFIGDDINSLPLEQNHLWITKAHKFTLFYKRRKFNAAYVGQSNLLLRIYDKVLELRNAAHKQLVFQKVWGVNHFDEKPVTRVEFQIRRTVLNDFHEFDSSLDKINKGLASLWRCCTTDWCRLAEEVVDRNHHQSRAVTHPWWTKVQNVEWEDTDLLFRVKRQACKDIDRVRMHGSGSYMSVAASKGCANDDIEGTLILATEALRSDLKNLFVRDPAEFERRMRRKKNEILGPLSEPFGPLDSMSNE
jgi:hypothetical protein